MVKAEEHEAMVQLLQEREKQLAEAQRDRNRLMKAVLEGRVGKKTIVVKDEGRDYEKELLDLLAGKLSGSANPKFEVREGYIYVRFDDIGPLYKLLIREVFRRRGPRPDLRGVPNELRKKRGRPRKSPANKAL